MKEIGAKASGESDNAVFYQRFPLRMGISLLLVCSALLLAIGAGATIRMAPGPTSQNLATVIKLLIVVCASIVAYFSLSSFIMIYNPTLEIDRSGVTFRRIRIPWPYVSDIVAFQTAYGPGVGLVLNESLFSPETKSSGSKAAGIRAVSLKTIRLLVNRCGVLPIPPLRGIEVSELLVMMAQVRHSVV